MLRKFQYFLLAILFFAVEICIAMFFHDRFVRPVFGDYLVIFLIYCILKSIISLSPKIAVLIVLLFAYVVELLQYLHITKLLGIPENTITKLILGSSFSWLDIFAYTLGGITILILEILLAPSKHAKF